jgi:hypoxanthine phosphoribosyltransferase
MSKIQIKDKEFALSIPESDILAAVKRVGEEINRDMVDKDPLFYLRP